MITMTLNGTAVSVPAFFWLIAGFSAAAGFAAGVIGGAKLADIVTRLFK